MISIIIATYKRENLIIDTLKCISDQVIDIEYEVIIIENSDFRSLLVEEYSKSFKNFQYVNYENHGATNARHYGFGLSKGDILVFIDDDITMSQFWLKSLIKPILSNIADQVAGRILLKFEAHLPKHLKEFKNFYSELDLGEKSFQIAPYQGCAVSANMAITREAFHEANGLNVCYYGREDMLHFSGDGECGLTRKLFDLKKRVYYCADAFIYHRIPASRCNEEYLLRRARNSGIENIYRLYRYSRYKNVSLSLNFFSTVLKMIFFYFKNPSSFKTRFRLETYRSQIKQILRVCRFLKLRIYILKENYLLPK